jgi:EmrB/QacA subfamily drug resistance transporter
MNDKRSRWLALYVLCLGDLMIVLDMNIVNVALPTIQEDLGFSQTALAWVVNAYLLTFGGFLLLSGRLADLYGAKRVFQGGVAFFTTASVACGLAWTSELLVIGRGIQGLGGAAVSAVALALIMRLFDAPADQAKAMGFFGFVMSGGGALGVLLGGVLTDLLSWNWIFLVNVPIGVAVWLLASRLLPADEEIAAGGRLDLPGAVLVTGSLMLATYGVVGGNDAGWTSVKTVAFLGTSLVLLVAFVLVEARSSHPLMPLRLFKQRNISVSQVVGVLWAGAMFACFFISALYMQFIQGWDALQIGLAYLPTCLVMAYCSLRVSDKLVMKYGIRKPLFVGLTLASASLGLFALAPVDGSYVVNVLPSMILLGIGAGIAFNPVLLAAMGDVEPHESGLASGVVNTSFMMGGALGLAVFVALSDWRTDNLLADGSGHLEALNGGYQLSFAAAAVAALAAAAIGGIFLHPKPMQMPGAEGSEVGQPEVEAGAV